MRELSEDFEQALLAVDRAGARRILGAGSSPSLGVCLDGIVVPALDRIGRRWEAGAVALSQVYMAGRIAEELIGSLAPPRQTSAGPPRVAIAVLEDHHLLGKRMVLSMLGAAGLEVADLGCVTVEGLVERVRAEGYQLLLVSVLMLPSALRVRALVEALFALGRPVPVIVGGAPFRLDPQLAARVGATAFGASASDAIPLVRRFLEARP